jgi:hypothetical protein
MTKWPIFNIELNYHVVSSGYESAVHVAYQGHFIVDSGRHNGSQPACTLLPAGLSKFADYAPFTVAAVVDTTSPSEYGRTHLASSRKIFQREYEAT